MGSVSYLNENFVVLAFVLLSVECLDFRIWYQSIALYALIALFSMTPTKPY